MEAKKLNKNEKTTKKLIKSILILFFIIFIWSSFSAILGDDLIFLYTLVVAIILLGISIIACCLLALWGILKAVKEINLNLEKIKKSM